METEIIVTNMLATGTAFGVMSDDMTQNVFIPSKHAINANLRPGQKILAKIAPNVLHSDKTPWVVISIEGSEPAPVGPVAWTISRSRRDSSPGDRV